MILNLVSAGRVSRLISSYASNWRFAVFIGAIFASTCGYWLLTTSVGVLVYRATSDTLLLTLVISIETLPMLLSPYAGVLADRYDRRILVAIATLLMMAVVGCLAWISTFGQLSIWLMFFVTLLLGLVYTFDSPARSSILPNLVTPQSITRAVAASNAAYVLARVIGPAMAGMLLGLGGAPLTLTLAAVLFAGMLPAAPLAKPIQAQRAVQKDSGFREGLRYLRTLPRVQVLLGFCLVSGTFGWTPIVLMPAIATDMVHTDSVGIGWLMSAGAVGSLLCTGALALGLVRMRGRGALLVGLVVMSAGMLGLAFSSDFVTTMLLAAVASGAMSTVYSVSMGLMHEILDDEFRGRVMGVLATGMSIGPIVYPVIGAISEAWGLAVGLGVTSALSLLAGVWLHSFGNRAWKHERTRETVSLGAGKR